MRIAITGIGIISSIGKNVHETRTNLENELSGISAIDSLSQNIMHPLLMGLPAGIVKMDNAALSADLDIQTLLPRTVLLGIKAAREALEMSQCGDFTFVNGNTVGGIDITEHQYAKWRKAENCDYIKWHNVGTCTELITNHLRGVTSHSTISTACSSALNSIQYAANLILSKKSSRVLAGGTECLTIFHLLGFNSLSILDKDICRPFDATRNGINLGEGAAYILLEDENSARTRGVEVLAYLSGFGNSCDAYHQTASSPNGEGAYLAMSKALVMAGRKPSEVDYINAHGTSTSDNDASESIAIKRLFGENYPHVSSTKGFTGHTTSASGSIDSVITLISMLNGFLPANLNWKTIDPDCITPLPHTLRTNPRIVMCNAFGFGGNDSSLLFESPDTNSRQLPELNTAKTIETPSVNYTQNDDYSRWIKPLEARRLSLQMRLIVAAAFQALNDAGIEKPDAIVTSTTLGTIQYTRLLLDDIADNGGMNLKPSWFMNSTHNSISSLLAIKLNCHGNNCTFSNARDARLYADILITKGEAENVLLLDFDEDDTVWNSLLDSQNLPHRSTATAKIISPNPSKL